MTQKIIGNKNVAAYTRFADHGNSDAMLLGLRDTGRNKGDYEAFLCIFVDKEGKKYLTIDKEALEREGIELHVGTYKEFDELLSAHNL